MNENPEQVVVINLPTALARDFERLLTEYAELVGEEREACRGAVETMVAESGLRALNEAVMANRRLAERMGWG